MYFQYFLEIAQFSLKCTWCGKCVTYPESIGLTLSMAPYAILSHLDIVHLDEDENDASDQLETLPILFTSHKNYEESFVFLMSHLNLALIQLKQMIKNSKLRVVVLFNRIEPGNFCFVKLLEMMHHYLMVI